jgi:hypothetical protein
MFMNLCPIRAVLTHRFFANLRQSGIVSHIFIHASLPMHNFEQCLIKLNTSLSWIAMHYDKCIAFMVLSPIINRGRVMSNIGDNSIRIVVVTNPEQLAHAFAIRAICIFEELNLTLEKAFDGNDYQCTRVVIYSGSEPIGSSRIRWFKDFAKIERTGFRQSHRNARVLRQTASFIFGHIASKGYSTVVTHAEPKLAVMWQRLLGFKPSNDRPPVQSGDGPPYIELIKTLEVPADAISLSSDPKILFRVEGYWHVPGAYEK